MTNEKRNCEHCQKDFLVLEKEQTFYDKKDIPWPTECPKCRQDKRLSLRNERNLYRRNCDKCQELIISPYRPESPYTIYCQSCFYEYVG